MVFGKQAMVNKGIWRELQMMPYFDLGELSIKNNPWPLTDLSTLL